MNRARVLQWMRDMEAERQTEALRLVRDNSTTLGPTGYTQKDGLAPDHPDYKAKVAEPTMAAVDALPEPYRAIIHDFGYIDVYRAWLRKWSVARIRDHAERMGGRFVL